MNVTPAVNECAVPQVNSDVRWLLARPCEEDQITRPWLLAWLEPPRGTELIPGVARKLDPLLAEHELCESRTIEAGGSAPAP